VCLPARLCGFREVTLGLIEGEVAGCHGVTLKGCPEQCRGKSAVPRRFAVRRYSRSPLQKEDNWLDGKDHSLAQYSTTAAVSTRRARCHGTFNGSHFASSTRFLRLEVSGWWSWSDSNSPPECYGRWGCPTSSPDRTSPRVLLNPRACKSWPNTYAPLLRPVQRKPGRVLKGIACPVTMA
jgi:hypothetical protein